LVTGFWISNMTSKVPELCGPSFLKVYNGLQEYLFPEPSP